MVFVTKYRYKVLNNDAIERLKEIFNAVCQDFESELIEVNGEADYIHLLISYPPKVPISKLVNSLKGVSSRLLRKEFPELQNRFYQGVLWSLSYFAGSCGGTPLSVVKQHIEQQRTITT